MNRSQPLFRHDYIDDGRCPVVPVGNQRHTARNAVGDLQLRQTPDDCIQGLMNRIIFHKEPAGCPDGC
jgi:hypothetical protein